ncbi:MAG: MmgE/PrpD family protein, partial [Candidatus Rokubacteria bacterium]|nr:MmgE/PrpD family protein [Candidatus Rokubacteria bacterium]
AIAIAASLASGVKENFGSMTKPYHAGHAARNGVLAALLAREGMTATATALEGKQGWLGAAGGVGTLEASLATLGAQWHLLTSGVAVKPYPSCAMTHAAIDALLDLRETHRLQAADVEAVEVGVNHVTPDVLAYPAPATPLQRKFSMQFCAAAALAEGRVDMSSFDDRAPGRDVAALMPRVRMVVDGALPDRLEQHAWSRVSVRLRDGRVLASPPRGAKGHPDQPLSYEALRAKFMGCAAALPREEAEGVADMLQHLEDIPDVRALTSRLVGDVD